MTTACRIFCTRTFVLLFAAMVSAVICADASAEAPTTLPASIVTASSPQESAIRIWLDGTMVHLAGDNAVDQQAARDAILLPFSQSPSPAFLYSYIGALNTALLPLEKSKNFRVRLNAAIITERVAHHDQNGFMIPSIEAFLKDDNEAVVMWAMKAIKSVMKERLIGPLKDAEKKFPALAGYAYDAMAVQTPSSAYIDGILDVMESRIKLYATAVPEHPLAERTGMNQLVSTAWWPALTPPQQARTAQSCVDLLAAVVGKLDPTLPNEQLEDLREVVRVVGADVQTIGVIDPNRAALGKPGEEARKLPRLATIDQTLAVSKGVCTALKASFPSITVPASISATNPTPASGNISSSK